MQEILWWDTTVCGRQRRLIRGKQRIGEAQELCSKGQSIICHHMKKGRLYVVFRMTVPFVSAGSLHIDARHMF